MKASNPSQSLPEKDDFVVFYKENEKRIGQYVFRRIGPAEWEDVTQVVWIAVERDFRDANRVNDIIPYSIRALGIAKNKVNEFFRSKKLRTRVLKSYREHVQDSRHTATTDNEFSRELRHVIVMILSDEELQIFRQKMLNGLTFREIEEKYNIPTSTACDLLSESLVKIKKHFEL